MPEVARTAQGRVSGVRDELGVLAFKGIPYARPPLGDLRFRPAAPPEAWHGIRDGSRFGPICPQPITPLEHFLGIAGEQMSEDCCHLNIWTPSLEGSRSVMVWFHGGLFLNGSGSVALYDGARLAAKQDVVVVTCNYRLGALGYTDLSSFGGSDYDGSGNAGLSDQIAVLRWVSENIGHFGGDPGSVCAFGESAGAISIASMFGSKAAKGLFARAILQSAAPVGTRSSRQAAGHAAELAGSAGLENTDVMALTKLSVTQLLDAQTQLLAKAFPAFPFGPVIDQALIQSDPEAALGLGAFSGGELMVGANAQEARLFNLVYPELMQLAEGENPAIKAEGLFGVAGDCPWESYRTTMENATDKERWESCLTDGLFHLPAQRLLDAHASVGGRCFGYLFSWPSPAFGGALGAYHGLEVPFPFGNLHCPAASAMTGASPDATALAEHMSRAWGSFAKSGAPLGPDGVSWPPWDPPERLAMEISGGWSLTPDPFGTARQRWGHG